MSFWSHHSLTEDFVNAKSAKTSLTVKGLQSSDNLKSGILVFVTRSSPTSVSRVVQFEFRRKLLLPLQFCNGHFLRNTK
jgi:AmiR/NasT family two-component response regulator